jgi:alditol oxidase
MHALRGVFACGTEWHWSLTSRNRCPAARASAAVIACRTMGNKQVTKREFLGMLAAGSAGLGLQSSCAREAAESMNSGQAVHGAQQNWAGNLVYSTQRLEEPDSIDALRAVLREHGRLKVLGTRHCFNDIADSSDLLLAMPRMNRVLRLDAEARTVTVQPAIRYGELALYLQDRGYALHNLASLPHISVAGACSTATHGSGEGNGNLSTAVKAVSLMTAAGDVVEFSRDANPEEFRGAVVALGALGVFTSVTLAIEPAYEMRQFVYEDLPMASLEQHFDAIQASAYSVSLFTDWQGRSVNEVWLKLREDGAAFAAPEDWYGAKRASRNLHPIVELSAENCTEQMGVPGEWYERLPHFRMGFTPSAGKELQSEYFVPRSQAMDAILAVERLRDEISPHLLISEIRTIAADDLWMSTAFGRPSVAIHFTWKQDWPSVSRLLPLIERELGAFEARPHWGKLFSMPVAELRARYPRYEEFRALATRLDPMGKFRNAFLDRWLFS